MELAAILTAERVRVPLRSTDKIGVITELVDLLAQQGALRDRDAVLQAVLKRESDRTTGIGYGLAIPHGKSDGCAQLAIAAGKPAAPIDFQSLDGRPVTFVVLLVSPPNQAGQHMQALAKVSSLMNIEEFRGQVAKAATAAALHETIRATEAMNATPR